MSPQVAGSQGMTATLGVTFIDYDHDGDLDLYAPDCWTHHSLTSNRAILVVAGVLPTGSNVMWRNNGNGTFTDVTECDRHHWGNAQVLAAIGTDYNNDRAVDWRRG